MVRGCCVCKKEKRPGEDISFHGFPKNEEEKRAWLKALGLDRVADSAQVCSNHFTDADYFEGDHVRRRLKRGINIVPSVNLNASSSKEQILERNKNNEQVAVKSETTTNLHTNTVSAISLQQCPLAINRQVLQDRTNIKDTVATSSSVLCITPGTSKQMMSNVENVRLTDEGHFDLLSDKERISLSNVSQPIARKRPRDDSKAVETITDEPSSKKLKLILGDRTMYYAKDDFVREEKWTFFNAYVEEKRKERKKLRRNYKNLQRSVKTAKDLVSTMQSKSILSRRSLQFVEGLSDGVQLLLASILQGNKYKQYPVELRNFALNLHFYSPHAYLFVKENFGDLLPSLSTLRSYLREYDFQPGISKEAFESVKRLIEDGKKKNKQILFNLTCDEMSVRQLPEYDTSADKYVGYVDYGTSKISVDDQSKSSLASNVLVFMLVALNSHFKIPVAHYFVKSCTGDHKKILLKEVLDEAFERDVDVVNLTFDGVSSNISMVEDLGATMKKSTSEVSFEYTAGNKTKTIRVTLDSCHALKLVRNIMAKYDITDGNGDVISWRYIKALQTLQTTEQLHPATKLRKRHIYFQNEIMKVSLAAQTLSSSVAKALDFCRVDLNLIEFKDSAATSTFVQNVNDSFDILNSRNIFNKNPSKHAISRDNLKQKKKRVEELVNYFKSLQIDGIPILETKQHTGFLGLVTGLQNVIAIAEDLFETFKNFSFVLTYKFSQDHLETFFSCIRRFGGFNVNPTVRQFKGALRKLLAHASISVPLSANCTPRDETVLGKINSTTDTCSADNIIDENLENVPVNVDQGELQVIFDLLDEVKVSDYVDDVVAYISGSVVRSIKRKISCETCLKELEMEKDENGQDKFLPISKLQRRKCYGKLISASHDVIQVCRIAEKVFRLQVSFAENNILERMILKTMHVLPTYDVFNKTDHVFEQEVLADHRSQLIRLIIKQYLTIRLHYASETDVEKQERLRLKLSKFLIFKGL